MGQIFQFAFKANERNENLMLARFPMIMLNKLKS